MADKEETGKLNQSLPTISDRSSLYGSMFELAGTRQRAELTGEGSAVRDEIARQHF